MGRNSVRYNDLYNFKGFDATIKTIAYKEPDYKIESLPADASFGSITINVFSSIVVIDAIPIAWLNADIKYSEEYDMFYINIVEIYACNKYRNRGIGSYLLNRLEELLDENICHGKFLDIDTIYFETDNYSDSIINFFKENEYNCFKTKTGKYKIFKTENYNIDIIKDYNFGNNISIIEDDNIIKPKFRLFISQPMSGLSDEEIIRERARGLLYFKNLNITDDKEIEVIDNLQMDNHYDSPLKYLSNDIRYMAEADAILFLHGWETHRGCIAEFTIAKDYGIKMYFE